MSDNNNKGEERRTKERRSNEVGEDLVDRRKSEDRRVASEDIDFPERRNKQRRTPIVGVDIKERRNKDRRIDTKDNKQ